MRDWLQIGRFTEGALSRRKKTALAPSLWLVAVVSATALPTGAVLAGKELHSFAWACFLLWSIVVLGALGLGVYFAIKDPDRLQSEEYRLRDRALNIIGEKGEGLRVAPVTLENVFGTYRPQLSPKATVAEAADPESEGQDVTDV